MVVSLRPPVAAGSFYELDPENLKKQLDFYFRFSIQTKLKNKTIAALVPHSAYIYSGKVAAQAYVNMEKSNFVILGSNHSNYGANFALMKNSLWKTPIGEVIVDSTLADKLIDECPLIEFDVIPHGNEFSIEVQLPFLLHRFRDFKILPILVINQIPDENLLENCRIVGKVLAKLIKKSNWKIIASSDLSQNIQKEFTEKTDKYLMKSISRMDVEGLFEKIRETNAKVCGYGAIASTIFAAKELGAKKVKIVSYGTSADLGEEDTPVVGYASVIFY